MEKELSIVDRVLEAQKTPALLNKLIQDYEPFIAKTVKQTCRSLCNYVKMMNCP